ncbi:hypothetical protein LPTSP2_39280 [Leptospira ellinghausenii]|uniref:Schlafen AlbA-2 domain-containing protein n=1 Tax=Leptospira ellinghausenii TaxID=1917822 RepID=A0A2P2DJ17_9LEPT|nr:ATP-binding protein [Leptospira ellinghausenii]GBF44625.1 hypothetical protein LPTSP2_39280 [Leptospira ellinghausenii]
MLTENAKLESFVLDIIDRIRKGQQIEDSRVELKSNLIEPYKAARRIAGHANAASGQNIVWIFGLSEDGGIIGIENSDIQDWFSKVKTLFDEVYPEFSELIISIDGKSILAIQFITSRAPYVLKNPNYGKEGSGHIEKEIPFREGTSIRSARRSDLLKILTKQSRSIEFEMIDSYLYLTHGGGEKYNWNIHFDLYAFLTFNSQVPLTIPFHRINLQISDKNGNIIISNGWNITGDIEKDTNISGGKTEFLLFGPSKIKQNATIATNQIAINYINEINMIITYEPFIYELNRTIKLQYSLVKEIDEKQYKFTNVLGRWILKK